VNQPRRSDPATPDEPGPRAPSAWQVAASAVAAAFGVQSSRNRERDFTHGKASHFIAAGIVFTVLFVLGMVVIVNLVLRNVG
jgi:hypothetical protein